MKTKIITTEKHTLSTGYRGRGRQPLNIEVPAGAEVDFEIIVTAAGTYKTISVVKDGVLYELSKKFVDGVQVN